VKERFIGFVGRSADDPAWRVLQAGALRYVKAAGPTPIRFDAPKTASAAAQNAIIRKLTDEGMAALCLDPVDPDLCTSAIDYAYQQGVRTFTMVHDASSPLRSAFIGPNNAEIGQLLARTTATALNGKGNVIVMHAGAEDPQTGGRYLSFRSTLYREPGINVLKWEDCQGDPDRAHTLLKDLLVKFPRMDAMVLIDNWPLRQRGVDAFQVPRSCRIISTTSTPPYWPFIEKGLCYSLIGTDYGEIGYTALRLANSADGQITGADRREYVASRVILENNLAQYKMDWRTWATFPDE
jgi:ABC-type sugar transport system substrate-binding protein